QSKSGRDLQSCIDRRAGPVRQDEIALIDYFSGPRCWAHHQPAVITRADDRRHLHGLGGARLEYLVYDREGLLLTGSLADYLLPTASDFPDPRCRWKSTPRRST